MKSQKTAVFILHMLLALLLALTFLPGERETASPLAMYLLIAILWLSFLKTLFFQPKKMITSAVLVGLCWTVLFFWLLFTSKLNWLQPILFPSPENVFQVYLTQYEKLLTGVVSSLMLLGTGLLLGVTAGVISGLAVGASKQGAAIFIPVAQVMAPIPPIIYAPYLVAIMPTFRSASALIIFLGIFWPTFLNMVLRVQSIELRILDTARTLELSGASLIFRILLPYTLPHVVSGLKVTMSTSIMLLLFAEMMGATSGMGFYISNNMHYANYTNVIAGIILVGLVVSLLNRCVSAVQKISFKWQ